MVVNIEYEMRIFNFFESTLKPYHWYNEHVIRGAKENGLPEKYIQNIAAIKSIDDPDRKRHDAELAIYL